MLSTTADHALRAVLLLGRAYGTAPVSADAIAEATGTPRNYMSKTLNALAKAGVLASSRGPSGGFTLAVAPSELTVAHVIDLFDDPHPSTRCLLGTGRCNLARPCAAHHRWTAINAARRAPLTSTTLADLLAGRAA